MITGLRPMLWTEDLKGSVDFMSRSLREQLKDKVEVCYGIEDFHYGMHEFVVYDNNGYLLQFGQEVERDE